jgi:hypothetical protein
VIEETKKEFRRLEGSTLCNVLADTALAADYIDELENTCEARYKEMVRLQNCNLEWSRRLQASLQLLRELDADIDYWRDEEKHKRLKEILKEHP